jgi:ATPase subunit of ABC transporter with duplicated ATPase domains
MIATDKAASSYPYETYKTETNFEIKRDRLTDIRSQRDALYGKVGDGNIYFIGKQGTGKSTLLRANAEESQLEAQLARLTSSLKDVESRYQNDRQRLETQCQQRILDFKMSLSKEEEKLKQTISDLTTAFYRNKKEPLTTGHSKKLEEQNLEKSLVENKLGEVGYQIDSIQKRTFLEDE